MTQKIFQKKYLRRKGAYQLSFVCLLLAALITTPLSAAPGAQPKRTRTETHAQRLERLGHLYTRNRDPLNGHFRYMGFRDQADFNQKALAHDSFNPHTAIGKENRTKITNLLSFVMQPQGLTLDGQKNPVLEPTSLLNMVIVRDYFQILNRSMSSGFMKILSPVKLETLLNRLNTTQKDKLSQLLYESTKVANEKLRESKGQTKRDMLDIILEAAKRLEIDIDAFAAEIGELGLKSVYSQPRRRLDLKKNSPFRKQVLEFWDKVTEGCETAKHALLSSIERAMDEFRDMGSPLGVYLFTGVAGTGKTSSVLNFIIAVIYVSTGVKVTAPPYIGIDGQGLQEEHRVSEVQGSPTGYIGSNNPEAGLITSKKIVENAFSIPNRESPSLQSPEIFAQVRRVIEEHFEKTGEPFTFKDMESGKVFQIERFISSKDPRVSALLKSLARGDQSLTFKKSVYNPATGKKEMTDAKVTVVLFDEIDKAHTNVRKALYSAMERGELRLAGGVTVNLKDCIVIFTSNVGERELIKFFREDVAFLRKNPSRAPIFQDKALMDEYPTLRDYASRTTPLTQAEIQGIADIVARAATINAQDARGEMFPLAFVRRINGVVAFLPFEPTQLFGILKALMRKYMEDVQAVQRRINAERGGSNDGAFSLRITSEVAQFIVKNADIRIGAGSVKQYIDRMNRDVTFLRSNGEIPKGSIVEVKLDTSRGTPEIYYQVVLDAKTGEPAVFTLPEQEQQTKAWYGPELLFNSN